MFDKEGEDIQYQMRFCPSLGGPSCSAGLCCPVWVLRFPNPDALCEELLVFFSICYCKFSVEATFNTLSVCETVSAAFELGRRKRFAIRRFITKLEMLHIPGFLKFYSSRHLTSEKNNGKRNSELEGFSARQCTFDDFQRYANSRWLTEGTDHNRNNNFSMWPAHSLLVHCRNSIAQSIVVCLWNKAHVYKLTIWVRNLGFLHGWCFWDKD